MNLSFQWPSGQITNRLGFGVMRLTGQPWNFGPYPKWSEGVELLRLAHQEGTDLFDSAWAYGPQTADKILGEALSQSKAFFATKGGVDKPAVGNIVVDGTPGTLRIQIEKALRNLRRDHIDLFQLHRVDPNTPIEISVKALEEARRDGLITHIGLSNVTREQLDRALQVAPIAAVQNRFNQLETEDEEMVHYTRQKNIAYLAYGPLGASPIKQGAKLDAQSALQWLLKFSPNIIPIPGTTSPDHLRHNLQVLKRTEAIL